jgi:hypothetical protein
MALVAVTLKQRLAPKKISYYATLWTSQLLAGWQYSESKPIIQEVNYKLK